MPTPRKATGSHFYKYSSPEHLERLKVIILEHELYFPNPSQLNDPADGRPKLLPLSIDQMVSFAHSDFIRRHPDLPRDAQEREAVKIRSLVQIHGPEPFQRMMAERLYTELDDYRIYSLSKRYDNLNLWAKYSANHCGYCLEFANKGCFASAWEVTYGEYTLDLTDRHQRGKAYFFFCKRQDWSNEEEVRILLPRGSNPMVRIEPRWLTRLILGKDMSDAHRKLIREWAKQREPELAVVNAYYDELHQVLRLTG
ncbi:MAG: DUF2971 domain-containing protein [Terriglobia bacterium]